jgi:hypothetical protein
VITVNLNHEVAWIREQIEGRGSEKKKAVRRAGIRELNPEDEYLASMNGLGQQETIRMKCFGGVSRIKGECMDRIGGDFPPSEDLQGSDGED